METKFILVKMLVVVDFQEIYTTKLMTTTHKDTYNVGLILTNELKKCCPSTEASLCFVKELTEAEYKMMETLMS